MADEVRNVEARLKVTKEGDTGAFKETADDIGELKEKTASATPYLDEIEKKLGKSGEAAKEAAEGTEELGKSSGNLAGKLAGAASTAAAVAGAFTVGWEVGTKFRDVLNDITKGGFDRSIQDGLTRLLGLNDGLEDGAGAADRYRNALSILKKNGIDAAGESMEEVQKKLDELTKKKNDAKKAAEEQAEAEAKWAEKLGLSGKALDESAKKLADFVTNFKKQNAQLSDEDLGEIFGKMIQEVLDSYGRLNKEVPPQLANIARQWGVTTSEIQKSTEKQKQVVDDLVASITGAVSKLGETLPQQLDTLQKAFEKIDFSNLDFGSEGYKRAQEFLQQYVDKLRTAGQQIPQSVADQAASMGILVGAMEVVADAAGTAAGKEGELATAGQGVKVVFDPLTGTMKQVATASGEAGTAAETAGSKIKTGADEAGKGKTPLDEINEEFRKLKSGQEGAGKAADEGAKKVVDGAQKIGDAKTGLKETGDAAGEAATGIGKIGEEAKKLDGEAATAAKTGLDKIKTDLGTVPGAVEPVVTALSGIETAVNKINALNFAGLLAGLDSVITKAKAAKDALDAIDGEGAPT